MSTEGPPTDRWLELVARREHAVALAGLAGIVALAWIHLVRLSREMADMAEMGMAPTATWTLTDAALAASMWAVMMVGMMLPSAAPMILMFVTVNRKRRGEGGMPVASTGLFTLGYLLAWVGFSLLAAAAQWGLQAAAVMNPEAMTVTPFIGAAVLIAAGIYQLTPLKYACLARCRSPLGFLLTSWRDGRGGAIVMGLHHGLYCLGCCWLLMALLFVGGVMNLVWVAAVAVFVLAEKVLPTGRLLSWIAGAALIVWGLAMLGRAL
jgi:predicted metal-binding membrane protein